MVLKLNKQFYREKKKAIRFEKDRKQKYFHENGPDRTESKQDRLEIGHVLTC